MHQHSNYFYPNKFEEFEEIPEWWVHSVAQGNTTNTSLSHRGNKIGNQLCDVVLQDAARIGMIAPCVDWTKFLTKLNNQRCKFQWI